MPKDSVFVNCWKCKKRFDITCAEKCYEHLSQKDTQTGNYVERWTTKCSHCGACICSKVEKMKPLCDKALENPRLVESGIEVVMPSVHKRLCSEK